MADSPNATPRPSISEGRGLAATPPAGQSSTSVSLPAPTAYARRPARRSDLKPIGLINETNTCFFNSTFQALSATAPLISILSHDPSTPQRPLPYSALPPPSIDPARIPAFQPEAHEPPVYPLLPINRTFLATLNKAWRMKDAGGGTAGSQEMAPGRCMSLRALLREIAKKYDQYDDVSQQDAHELLRHLLDSMEMEEKDVIKLLQPPASREEHSRRRKKSARPIGDGISPLPSPLPSPIQSRATSPTRVPLRDPFAAAVAAQNGQADGATPRQWAAGKEHPHRQELIPWVDVLFGGSLASVIVCERCKSVSHTYEGFLDISLSLKDDDPKPRKRDRLMGLASRLRSKPSSGSSKDAPPPPPSAAELLSSSGILSPKAAVSDTELSDAEKPKKGEDRRRSLDIHDDRPSTTDLERRRSSKGFGGLKGRTSFAFRKKDKDKEKEKEKEKEKSSRPASATSSTPSQHVESEPKPITASPVIMPTSPVSTASASTHKGGSHAQAVGGPTPAQAAYIARILAPPPGPDLSDPLARLRAAHNGEALQVPAESGLIEALKSFTSVEVLEGENAFACKKCWKIKTSKPIRGRGREPTLREEDESVTSPSPLHPVTSVGSTSTAAVPPSIAISSTSDLSDDSLGPLSPDEHIERSNSLASHTSKVIRAPSPLRQHLEALPDTADGLGRSISGTDVAVSFASETSLIPSAPIANENHDLFDGDDGDTDGLSGSDSSSEEEQAPPSQSPAVRPKMPNRKKSTHYVMRRAFKRYLIAKAPEVLVFHFKRFKQTHKGSIFYSFYDLKKVEDFISFPAQLDLAPFMAPNRHDYKVHQTPLGPRARYMDWTNDRGPQSQAVMYKLYAVVVHLGTMIGGHYIAYCLVDPEKMFGESSEVDGLADSVAAMGLEDHSRPKEDRRIWCYCSDTEIRRADEAEVLAASAYLCFYEKVSVK